MKNQGISLISLIITIIVIIILAAIVIFTGLGTPDSANFAHFCQDCDNVYSQVLNRFADLKVAHATANQTRSDEQIYIEVATDMTSSTPANQYMAMSATSDTPNAGTSGDVATGDSCQRIIPGHKISLPEVRENVQSWYVTKNGQVFNATGYVYNVEGKPYTYFSANVRHAGALSATKEGEAAKETDRSETIAGIIVNGGTTVTGLDNN